MINFTVGPVQSSENIRNIGAEQVPYFRTPEFSQIMLENEKLMLEFSNATEGSKTVFITGSGTASMEAAVENCVTNEDKVLVINGGGFGKRFCELLEYHKKTFDSVNIKWDETLIEEHLKPFESKGFTMLFDLSIDNRLTNNNVFTSLFFFEPSANL